MCPEHRNSRHSQSLFNAQPRPIRPFPPTTLPPNQSAIAGGWARFIDTMFTLTLCPLLLVGAARANYVYVPPPAPVCYGSGGQEVTCPASQEVVTITVCSVPGGILLISAFSVLFYQWKRGQRRIIRKQDMNELELRRELLHPAEQV